MNLQPGSTRAWLSIEQEDDNIPPIEDYVCAHGTPLDEFCRDCDIESEGI